MAIVKNVSILLLLCICVFTTASGKVTNDELHSFPKMFFLDDFNRCLSKSDGLYCLGTLELTATQPNTILDLMKQHTKERYTFNRTLLRRGYCLSERCPRSEANSTLRFENCVAKHIKRYSLRPRLKKLHYCTTFQERQEKIKRGLNLEQTWFVYAIGVVLMLNLAGTVHHYTNDNKKLNPFLLAWSVPWNWARFTKVDQRGILATLAPLQCVRMVMQSVVIFAHATLGHYKIYVQNVEYLEELPAGYLGIMLGNGTCLVQIFILISCFLTSFNLLYSAQKMRINAKTLFIWCLKRLTKVLPVYLLVLGFVVTYWRDVGDGPLWDAVVGQECDTCRRKFWTQMLFINNLVMPQDMCMLQTWAIAVDMQMYILTTVITILLMKLRVRAVPALLFLFISSVALTVLVAYVNGWVPVVKLINAETLRNTFKDLPSFTNVHLSPWASMPACILGLLLAHIFFEKTNKINPNMPQNDKSKKELNLYAKDKEFETNDRKDEPKIELDTQINDKRLIEEIHMKRLNVNVEEINNNEITNGYKTSVDHFRKRNVNGKDNEVSINEMQTEPSNNIGVSEMKDETYVSSRNEKKRKSTSVLQNLFIQCGHIVAILAIVLWVMAAAPIVRVESPLLTALYVGAERAVFTLLAAILLTHLFTVDSGMRRFGAWHGWQAMGRLVYAALLLHWVVNASIVASRTEVIGTSIFYFFMDCLTTLFITYVLALPVHLFLELPAQKFLDLLISVPSTMSQYRQ